MTSARYKILGPCGHGGMSQVFKAQDLSLPRLVALKQMAPTLEKDEESVAAFKREAAILAQLSDRNIVTVLDSFTDDEGHHYLVMQYIEGEDLGKVIKRGPTLVPKAVDILNQALTGLRAMHSHDIIHQDIKPGNILIDSDGIPKIVDLGLATIVGQDGPTLKWGSAQWLAPEVFTNDKDYVPDARVDIYALGMVAFELLVGEKAFRAECQAIYENESEISRRWANWNKDPQQRFRPLSEINPEIPTHLSQVVARMLSKDRTKRYGDVTSVIRDLNDKRVDQPVEEPEDPSTTKPLGYVNQRQTPVTPPDSGKKKSRTLLYVSGTISILVFLFLLFAPKRNQLVWGNVSSNAGAELTIDGRKWGLIPEAGKMRGKLPPGSHTAKLTLKDHETVEAPLVIESSKIWDLHLPLHSTAPPPPPPRLDLPSGVMLLVPAGEFQYGANNQRTSLPAFYMDETEVTNSAYLNYCGATSHAYPPNPPWDRNYFLGKQGYPVFNVTWDEAVAFAQWAGKRLPTELEWEKAARGTDGRIWPWGSEFDPKKANLGGAQDGFLYTAPVGSFPAGASPYGMLDMAGNVWEWVANAYGPSLGPNDGVLKGGAFVPAVGPDESKTFFHGARPRSERPNSIGFRCAKNVPAPTPAPTAQPSADSSPQK